MSAILEVCVDPEQAYFVTDGAPIYPATIKREDEVIDFAKNVRLEPIRQFGNIAVELSHGGTAKKINVERAKLDRMASFLCSTPADNCDYNCQAFAWSVCAIDLDDGPQGCEYTEAKEAKFNPGDLVSVGTITNFMGLDFAKLHNMVHWAVYLKDDIALNITGIGGVLAGTPLTSFPALYPGSATYKVENY